MLEFENLLVPVDFSAHSERALEVAMELAETFDARVYVLHVYHLPVYIGTPEDAIGMIPHEVTANIRKAAEKQLGQTVERARALAKKVPMEAVLEEGSASERIVEVAARVGADLVVMGTRGRTGLAHILLGSVAERTIRTAPCPVLTLKVHD